MKVRTEKEPKRAEPRWMEYQLVKNVKGNPANPKDHDLYETRESIRRWGFTNAIILDERTGLLAAGHGRIEILRSMELAKEDPPPGIMTSPDGWLLPVQRGWSSKDDLEAKAYLVADNAIGEGLWNEDALTTIAKEVAEKSTLLGTGISEKDLEKLQKLAESATSVKSVETSRATDSTFWVSVRGPLPAQVEALDLLKAQLKGIPGVEVMAGVLAGRRKGKS